MQYEKRPIGQITKSIGGLALPLGSVSTRCRSKHDTPKGFSARCVLWAGHTMNEDEHQDKYGNRWGEK